MRGQQLPLAVQLREPASFESFYPGDNAAAVAALREPPAAAFLYGAAASGKTHLLQAAVRAHGGAYVSLAELAPTEDDHFAGLTSVPLLALDDVHVVSMDTHLSLGLLRLLDARRAAQRPSLLAAQAPPERMTCVLPDLRTRLSAAAVFGLKPLSDEQRTQLLRERAQARGLALPDEVARWLLTHLPRDTGSLLAALAHLDRAALAEKRRLTLPFVQLALASANAQTTASR